MLAAHPSTLSAIKTIQRISDVCLLPRSLCVCSLGVCGGASVAARSCARNGCGPRRGAERHAVGHHIAAQTGSNGAAHACCAVQPLPPNTCLCLRAASFLASLQDRSTTVHVAAAHALHAVVLHVPAATSTALDSTLSLCFKVSYFQLFCSCLCVFRSPPPLPTVPALFVHDVSNNPWLASFLLPKSRSAWTTPLCSCAQSPHAAPVTLSLWRCVLLRQRRRAPVIAPSLSLRAAALAVRSA